MPHEMPTSPMLVRGIAAWLRKAAEVTERVELSPKTAMMIAELLDRFAGPDEVLEEAA